MSTSSIAGIRAAGGSGSGRPGRRRAIALLLVTAQALYWAYTMWLGIRQADDDRGYQWMAAFFSTPPFVVFTLPAFLLVLLGRAPRFALFWAALGCAFVPFTLWGMIAAAVIDGISPP